MGHSRRMDESDLSAEVARYKPYYYRLIAGKRYAWCSCGRSATQPFCDGSHQGTSLKPLPVRAEHSQEVLFCGCKQTKTPPFCDGTHTRLLDTYPLDDPNSEANRHVAEVAQPVAGRLLLNGHCFIARTDELATQQKQNLHWSTVVDQSVGARYQSQFHIEVGPGRSPALGFGEREVVLLAIVGEGELRIGPRTFRYAANTGYYVRPGEQFALHNPGEVPLRFFASVCPLAEAPNLKQEPNDYFDEACPNRSVTIGAGESQAMADRSFQLLVDRTLGCDKVTQFAGHIPRSKAQPHRHLYEEALIILKGKGCLWTEDLKGRVGAGDVVFLPAQQIHSLEATEEEGMVVAGVIYPGVNPDINY